MFFEYENVTLKITRNRVNLYKWLLKSTRFVISWNLCAGEGCVAVVWSFGKPFYTSLTYFDLAPQKPST